jgi:hypothetical protein
MQLLSKDEFAALIVKLNSLVTEVAGEDGSAMEGLTMLSCAFGALLDSYAKPNGENPRGMWCLNERACLNDHSLPWHVQILRVSR